MFGVLADDRRGIGRQRGQPDHRFVGGERNAARGGESDAQPGKAAGAGGHRDAVKGCERDAGLLDDARDQRHQGFGMTALHGLRFQRYQFTGVGIENACGAGIQRGVDG